MVRDFRTSFISVELKSRRADSPEAKRPERSKKPTPCLYSTTCFTGNSAGRARVAERSRVTKVRIGSPIQECREGAFPFRRTQAGVLCHNETNPMRGTRWLLLVAIVAIVSGVGLIYRSQQKILAG